MSDVAFACRDVVAGYGDVEVLHGVTIAVRAGTMSGYSKATIGQAFESAFKEPHWSSRQLKSGARVVTFTGLLPANMRPNCGAANAPRSSTRSETRHG